MSAEHQEFNGPKYFFRFVILAFLIYMIMFYLWYLNDGHKNGVTDQKFISPSSDLDSWEYSNSFIK